MKVTKFGGSSVATSKQIRKILDIVKSDKSRQIIVVSAPGKRCQSDQKVTDVLIAYYHAVRLDQSVKCYQNWLITRFTDLAKELKIRELLPELIADILELERLPVKNKFSYDHFLAFGEKNTARLIAAYFTKNGLNAHFVSPDSAGILLSNESGAARLLPEAYPKIGQLKLKMKQGERLVIPGFYGFTAAGEICTFSRGGSDITGSILAAGVQAELYENFTDVDGILAASPDKIERPMIIEEVTYREMRELAFSGFAVLHDEALIPVSNAAIPMVLKNTNKPELPGTRIVSQWSIDIPIVGIASTQGFAIVKITKYMLSRELGFVRQFFAVFEKLNLHFEAITTGIDDLSVLVREKYLTAQIEQILKTELTEILCPDEIQFTKQLAVVSAVGEEIRQQTHLTSRATSALARHKIKIETLMQGASEVSLLFIVHEKYERATVKALYSEFFE